MTAYRAQVILVTNDAVPANYATNSWCIETTDDSALNTSEVTTALKDFYDDLNTQYSNAIAQNGHIVKYSDLPGVQPNYPFEEDTFNLASAPSGSPLPSEVSLVLSFQGTRQAGFPQRRRRGRIYIGPLSVASNTSGRPGGAALTQIANAAATFKSNIDAITGTNHQWAVWSVADQTPVPIANGWIDNAYDTQRRRGLATTSRTTFV